MELMTIVLATTAVSGLYLAWNIGANDVANAMGTSVGSGALTLRSALVVAGIFELTGALLVGGTVTQTISGGIVDVASLGIEPVAIAVGMTSCLIASAIWLHVATFLGWPVSTTHTVVGAMLGFGLWTGGPGAVQWGTLGGIVGSWLVSPALAGVIAFAVFNAIRRTVLGAPDPARAAQRMTPTLVFPVLATFSFTLLREAPPLGLALDLPWALAGAAGLGAFTTAAFTMHVRRRGGDAEGVFLGLQLLTAAFMAFAHGSNDVANAVGPIAAVFSSVREGVDAGVRVPTNVLLIGAFGIVLGLGTYGFKVMATIGREITQLTPSRGFAAEFGASFTIVLASQLGIPVSTTHTLVGAVIGVGFARSLGALNLRVIRGITASWIITLPLTALLTCLLMALGSAFH